MGCGLKLGALFWRLGRYEEGRAALREAAELAPATAPLLAARCHRWLGQLEIEDCRDEEAWAALGRAEAILQGRPDQGSDDWVESWLGVELTRSNLHYWRAEVERQAAVLSRIQPLVESRARPWQKAEFEVHMAGQRWRAGRFVVDDDIVAEVTAARSMAAEAGLDLENFHWHTLGFVLLLHGDLVQATLELDGALAAARRAGDGSLELAGLAFLAWAHLRGGDVAGVKHVLDESAGLLSGTFPTSGMVRAMAVWVAWKEGRVDEVEPLAEDALSRWRRCIVRYPFCWICLWPLIAARLAGGRDEDAMAAARDLVSPPQMRLPARLEAMVISAVAAWGASQHSVAVSRLKTALTLAEKLNFI